MFKKLQNVLLTLGGLMVVLSPALVTSIASAQSNPAVNVQGNLCSGSNIDLSGGSTTCDTSAGTQASATIAKIINIFSVIVGAVSVIMIIYGGLRYVVSGGESSSVSGAKNTIIFAVVGLIVVALAQVIVHFVLHTLNTGS